METKHAMLSPSGAERWMTCIGSLAMEYGKPDNGNEYSNEGTCAHAVAKMCLVEKKPATAYIGRRIDVGPHETYEFREDMCEGVQCYVDFVNSLPGEKHFEVGVPIGHVTLEADAEGTADVVAITDDYEEIICADLKFGKGVFVNAEKNKQAMLYALGALAKFDVMGTFKRITIYVHQPRVSEEPSMWQCTVEELLAFAAECTEVAKTAHIAFEYRSTWMPGGSSPSNEYLNPSEKACQFCKARVDCPALTAYVEHSVGEDLPAIAASDPVMAKVATNTNLQGLDGAGLSVRMQACNLIEDWIKAVRAEVERRLLASQEVPGYKLVTGRQGNRAWTDPVAAEELLRKQFRLPIEDAFSLKLISPTQAEKVLKEHPKRWAKCIPLIARAPGVPSVAPESDGRPALSVKPAADDFAVQDVGADLV